MIDSATKLLPVAGGQGVRRDAVAGGLGASAAFAVARAAIADAAVRRADRLGRLAA